MGILESNVNIKSIDASTEITLAAGNNNIGDVDVLSVVPGTTATALGKAEDTAHATGDTGVMALAVRTDTSGSLAGTDGDYAPLQVDSATGGVKAAIGRAAVADSQTLFPASVTDVTGANRTLAVVNYLSDGATTFERERGNINLTALASAARTASVNSADLTNINARGLHLIIDVTAIAATPIITVTIEGKDALSGKYYDILESVAISAVGTTVLRVYPALTAAANTVANDILPRTWRVSVVNTDADSITYSVGASLVL